MGVEEKVLARIVPSADEVSALSDVTAEIISRISSQPDSSGTGMEPRLVGSVAKGTFLKDPDLDVFLVFPSNTPFDIMVRTCEGLGNMLLSSMERRFADHPYVHGLFSGYEVDLVPCYRMENGERVMSAVDRTPLHTDHIIQSIKPHQKDEVRLLKAFMKGIGVYGADSRSRGFSGYLTELLVLHYGDFHSVLNAAKGWRKGETILTVPSTNGYEGNLIVNDPVDPHRNVASAVHIDSLSLFIHASKVYLERGDERFFFPGQRELMSVVEAKDVIASRGTRLLCAIAPAEGMSDDNLHSQAQKALGSLSMLLIRKGYNLMGAKYLHDGDIHFIFELEHDTLPGVEIHNGPPVWVANSEDFIAKWEDSPFGPPFIKDGRWMVFRRRAVTTAADVLRSNIGEASLGAGIDQCRLSVIDHENILRTDLMMVVTHLLDNRPSWDL